MTESSLISRIDRLRHGAPTGMAQHEAVAQWRPPTEADIDGIHAVAAAADAVVSVSSRFGPGVTA